MDKNRRVGYSDLDNPNWAKVEGTPASPATGFPLRSNKASRGEVRLRRIAYRKPLAIRRRFVSYGGTRAEDGAASAFRVVFRVNKMGFKNGLLQFTYGRVKNCAQIMNNHRKIIKLKNDPILFTII